MKRKLLLLLMFAVAMGYLEAAVVVYLRAVFYPEGFDFPLRRLDLQHALVELGREAATIVMLVAVAGIAERTRRGRLACFMLLFGVWDIFYYVFLRVILSWPASLLTWDILFLIPVIWTGPVLAPVLVSLLLVTASLIYYARQGRAERITIAVWEWTIAATGGLIIFVSFALNHSLANQGAIPSRFPWEAFAAGMVLALVPLARVTHRLTSKA